MSNPFEKPSNADDQLWLLVEAFCDGDATPAECDALNERLANDSAARRFYLAYLQTHAELAWQHRGQIDPSSEPLELPAIPVIPPSSRPTVPPPRTPVLGFLASISRHVPGGEFTVGGLLLLVIVAAFWGLSQAILYPRLGGHDIAEESSHPPTVPSSDRAEAVATIRDTSDVEWSSLTPASTRGEGSAIAQNQPLSIQSGLIELQLKQGTTLLIEGPADWKINGENSATLTHGKLVARVPKQAVGFTLETPTARIIDLGTEFGVQVTERGTSSVQVIKGQVQIAKQGQAGGAESSSNLVEGQAVKVEPGANPVSVPFNPQAFTREIAAPIANAPVTPEQIAGLRLWLRADRGVELDAENHVERWADQSGHGFDAMQAHVAQRPALKTASENAPQAVKFDGQDDFLECESSLGIQGDGDSTIVVLMRTPAAVVEHAGIFSLRSKLMADWTSVDGMALTQCNLNGGRGISIQQQLVEQHANLPGTDELYLRGEFAPVNFSAVILTKSAGVAGLRINGVTVGFEQFDFSAKRPATGATDSGYCLAVRFDDGHQRPGHCLFGANELVEVIAFNRALHGREGKVLNDYLMQRLKELSPPEKTAPAKPK